MSWSDGLDVPMLRIAKAERSPLLVLGGPGTRKTFALMRRVARLLECGQSPSRILVVTFTRTAARDLVTHLQELDVPGCDTVRACTLHSFCFGTLATQGVFLLTSRVPRPLLCPSFKSKFEVDFLLQDLADRFGGMRERLRRLRAFEAAWARLQSDEPGWVQEPVDRDFQQQLLAWLRFHEAMLVGELVPVTLSYLRSNPQCEERNAFDHVVVDEYQDLNKAEQVLVDLLAQGQTLSVAGDADQSIYSFKFAHPEGVTQFVGSHPGTHEETLSVSGRCPRKVVEMANCLISENRRPEPVRPLVPSAAAQAGDIHIVQWRSLEEEAEGLARLIHHIVTESGIAPGRVLVLAPRRVIGYAIRNALQDLHRDAHSFFHEEALEPGKAQERFTLLTLLGNGRDPVALRCWLGFGSPSLRRNAYARLRQHCEQGGSSPWDVLEDLESGRLDIPRTGELMNKFRELKVELSRLRENDLSALIGHLFPEGDPELEAIRGLALEVSGSCSDVRELREELRVRVTQPELPSEGDYVRIMSLHKAKGLTADFVVIAGCIEGFIPTRDDRLSKAEQERQLEEQRRLFYVAITRPTRCLVLSSFTDISAADAYKMGARIRHRGRNRGKTIASGFLGELGPSAPRPMRGQQLLIMLGAEPSAE